MQPALGGQRLTHSSALVVDLVDVADAAGDALPETYLWAHPPRATRHETAPAEATAAPPSESGTLIQLHGHFWLYVAVPSILDAAGWLVALWRGYTWAAHAAYTMGLRDAAPELHAALELVRSERRVPRNFAVAEEMGSPHGARLLRLRFGNYHAARWVATRLLRDATDAAAAAAATAAAAAGDGKDDATHQTEEGETRLAAYAIHQAVRLAAFAAAAGDDENEEAEARPDAYAIQQTARKEARLLDPFEGRVPYAGWPDVYLWYQLPGWGAGYTLFFAHLPGGNVPRTTRSQTWLVRVPDVPQTLARLLAETTAQLRTVDHVAARRLADDRLPGRVQAAAAIRGGHDLAVATALREALPVVVLTEGSRLVNTYVKPAAARSGARDKSHGIVAPRETKRKADSMLQTDATQQHTAPSAKRVRQAFLAAAAPPPLTTTTAPPSALACHDKTCGGRTFTTAAALAQHGVVHARTFVCRACNAAVSSAAALERHGPVCPERRRKLV